MITKEEVIKVQQAWKDAMITLGRLNTDRPDFDNQTEIFIRKLYALEKGEILFKPTKASAIPFRSTLEGIKSYFIGGNSKFPEDKGFALHRWKSIRFLNHHFIFEECRAFAMGHYFFTDAQENEIKVEFTFGYWKNDQGELKIDIQHSSLPYQAPV